MVAWSQFGLRAIELLLTILITALVGNVIQTAFAGNPSSINYAIFVAAFSWIVVVYGLVASFIEGLAIPIVLMALDGIAVLLTFIAGVVLAAKLGVHSCGNAAYVASNNLTNGSHNMSKRCHELQASTAFFWFLFVAFIGSLVLSFLHGKSAGGGMRGGMRRGGPSMSQV